MCTVRLAPAATLMGWPARLSCWLPSAPLMAKLAGLPVEVSMTQCTGLPALPPGRASVRVTPVALPAPVLLTVTVKPMGEPADTLAASADLATWTSAGRASKHSVVSLVCDVARYLEPAAGVYSARKQ